MERLTLDDMKRHLNALPVKIQKATVIRITRILSTWKTININALSVKLARI